MSQRDKFDDEIQDDWGWLHYGGVVFDFLCGIVSPKRHKIERRSQLITNKKSYMGFRFVQKSMTLNDLNQ